MPEYTADQKRAVEEMDAWADTVVGGESSFFSLQGTAGVGKTWLTVDWIASLLARKPRLNIVVTAPTNKAVDVLRAKAKSQAPHLLDLVTFRTLDSFLGFRIKRNDDWEVEKHRHDSRDKSSPDIVLVDEAGMVKNEYHEELKRRRVAVLYVGDPSQLLPVGENCSPAFGVQASVRMTEVVRQSAGNPIIAMATFLRGHIEADTNDFILQDMRQFAGPGDRRISFTPRAKSYDWAEAAVGKGLDCRILAFTNAAVADHNRIMHARMYPDAPMYGAGELVLVNEAFEYDDDVFLTNGELLRVVTCELDEPIEGLEVYKVEAQQLANNLEVDGEVLPRVLTLYVAMHPSRVIDVHRDLTAQIYACLDRKRKGQLTGMGELNALYARRRPLNKLAPLRHAYACTVHKSQGSTYDVALVDFSDIYKSREMRARLLYVAATRPSQFLALIHNGG